MAAMAEYGDFIGNADRRRLNDLRQSTPEKLASSRPGFEDARLTELLWRYRARNFPQSLSPEEQQRWEAHRTARLFDGQGEAQPWSCCWADSISLLQWKIRRAGFNGRCADNWPVWEGAC